MKILLLGKNGQVGWELQRSLATLGKLIVVDRTQADLSDPLALRSFVASVNPDWIVNAAAYTSVDKAENDSCLAYTINAESVKVLAQEAARIGAWLVHYSTDYVYDGKKQNHYFEHDNVSPLSVYGHSKLAGENYIIESGCNYLIFRTSWVFASKGHNFAKSMIKLAADRDSLRVVSDQYGTPTSAELIADVTANCMWQINTNEDAFGMSKVGIYHLVSDGEASWYSYAKYIIEKATSYGVKLKTKSRSIKPICTEDYPLPAVRPKNSRLSTKKLQDAFSIRLPEWTVYVDRMLEEVINRN